MAQNMKKDKNTSPLASHLTTELMRNKPFVFIIEDNCFPPA